MNLFLLLEQCPSCIVHPNKMDKTCGTLLEK